MKHIIIAGKKYNETETYAGMTIESAMSELIKEAKGPDGLYCLFNGHVLYSDMSIDEAYSEITGSTYAEFQENKRRWLDEIEKENEKYEKKIPELVTYWKREGRKFISEDKIIDWDKIVQNRLHDIYKGLELGACLEIIDLLNQMEPMEHIEKALDSQGHSGTSYSIVCHMVKDFADRGDEFFDYIRKTNS